MTDDALPPQIWLDAEYTVEEAARLCGVSAHVIWWAVEQKRLKVVPRKPLAVGETAGPVKVLGLDLFAFRKYRAGKAQAEAYSTPGAKP